MASFGSTVAERQWLEKIATKIKLLATDVSLVFPYREYNRHLWKSQLWAIPIQKNAKFEQYLTAECVRNTIGITHRYYSIGIA